VELKKARLARFANEPGYTHIHARHHRVVHLAAQAGVRYSIDNPLAYGDSNLSGFLHVLEACRHHRSSTWSTPAAPASTAATRRCRSRRPTASTIR
jgi:nucleoside-diphosphate-sugar epimerase